MTYTERISKCCGAPIDDFGYCTECGEHAAANERPDDAEHEGCVSPEDAAQNYEDHVEDYDHDR